MTHPAFRAIYGKFNEHMLPQEVTNVTDIITANFLDGSQIVIPRNHHFQTYFGNNNSKISVFTDDDHLYKVKLQRKFLQIQINDRKYNILEDIYTHDIKIDLNNTHKCIKLIYYIFIDRYTNWISIVHGQLLQLKAYGLLDEVDLYIHITDPSGIFSDVINLIETVTKAATVSQSVANQFEYPGIKLAYDLSKDHPDDIFIYFHTKGMSYGIHSRLPLEIALTTCTFENWRRKMEAFNDSKVNKMGLFPAAFDPNVVKSYNTKGGWMWYNFWYARGRYLANSCENPKITFKRWYYEVWLGGPFEENEYDVTDCKNLYQYQNKTVFAGIDIERTLPDLIAMGKQCN